MLATLLRAAVFAGAVTAAAGARAGTPPADPFATYQGKVAIPADLRKVYSALVVAIAAWDVPAVHALSLPQAVSVAVEPRPEATREYGTDLNRDFAQRGFAPAVLNAVDHGGGTLLLRTGSSYLFFVKTKSAGWKLYRYGDKPIE